MGKVYIYILSFFFSITPGIALRAMDDEAPQVSKSSLQGVSDEIFLDFLRALVPTIRSVKQADVATNNGIIKALICIKITCKQFNNLLNTVECSRVISQKALDTMFGQKLAACDGRWLPLLMQCGAKVTLGKAYMRELDLIETQKSYSLPHVCTLALSIDDNINSESDILSISKILIAGGATTNYPYEPTWLYIFTKGTALEHAIKRKFHRIIDFLISQGHPIEETSLNLAQETDAQIHLRLARYRHFNTNTQDDTTQARPELPQCTLL